ncbi:MAG: Hpt domain-containing protein, partial [Treponema sp.]|nr:Hpt domain-containing protein [Treponema sp.]
PAEYTNQPAKKETGIFSGRNVDCIDLQKGLERFSGDEEVFMGILRSWVNNTRSLLKKVKALNKDNLAEYATTVHGIKGSSRGISADKAGDLAEDLEKAAKADDFEFVQKNNERFLEITEKLITGVSNMLSDISEKNQKPKKEKPDSELLSKLLAACEAYDMDKADEAAAELEAYDYFNDSGLAAWLKDKVSQGNLSEIIEKLST